MFTASINLLVTTPISQSCRDFLPRGSGIVTRRPLILQLMHANAGDLASVCVFVFVCVDCVCGNMSFTWLWLYKGHFLMVVD